MSDDADDIRSSLTSIVGAGFLLLLISGCCLFSRPGSSEREAMRACAEACGERGMDRYHWQDGCVCREESP